MKLRQIIRIGTRDSQLATWQANLVKQKLEDIGLPCELVYIKSDGDIDLITPLYEMGVQGVFTKQLDAALLNNRIDLAVHSMKDVPVVLAEGIAMAATLPRGNHKDVLIIKNAENQPKDLTKEQLTIATSSIRRKAQWLNRYPEHRIDNLRGNINTRLQKLADNDWYGAIFAAAGLERLNLAGENQVELDWMLPAPAQGIICVTCRKEDKDMLSICSQINDADSQICAKIERDFLRGLMGGCSSPIAALAQIKEKTVHFQGRILSLDGSESQDIQGEAPLAEAHDLGQRMAERLLKSGADRILNQIRNGK